MDVIKKISSVIGRGVEIPKPEATEPFLVKDWGKRRGEDAIVYFIPKKSGGKPYEKGITTSELKQAYEELCASGAFTREWFNRNLAACAKEGGCNFTTIGGLFRLIGEAQYIERGIYRKI